MLIKSNTGVYQTKPLILLGAGGHAKVLLGLIQQCELPIFGICDPTLWEANIKEWNGLPVLGDDSFLDSRKCNDFDLVLGVGQLVNSKLRKTIYQRFTEMGFTFPNLIHPTAFVDPSVSLNKGVQVMAGAVIQPGVTIGENVIVNTSASIDHDCKIDAHVHIAPGATLCGGVQIESEAFIGAGSTIIQEISIGRGSVVTAGSLLSSNLPPNQKTKKRI